MRTRTKAMVKHLRHKNKYIETFPSSLPVWMMKIRIACLFLQKCFQIALKMLKYKEMQPRKQNFLIL